MENNRYKIGQKVKIIGDNNFENLIGTIKSVEIRDSNESVYCVCFDCWFLQVNNQKLFEVVEDVKEEVEKQQTEEIKHSKISDEEIALELVKSWGGQSGNPAKFSSFISNYFEALKQIKGGRYETNR